MQQLIANREVIFPKQPTGRPRRKKYVKDLTGDFAGFSTVLNTVYNTQATREVRAIFDDKEYFDFPKPVDLIKILIEQGTSPMMQDGECVILDFFSGSATTAHAVMQLNAEDGGNRKFICVQLPEVTDEKSEAYKAGYKNICEIGKERIRRAGAKVKGEQSAVTAIESPSLGVAIGFAIALHNIPEGIAVSVPIYQATGSRTKAFWYSFLSGLSEPIGAVIAYFVLAPYINESLMGIIFAVVAGVMIYVSIDELLPAARSYGKHHASIFGVIVGMAIMALTLIYMA